LNSAGYLLDTNVISELRKKRADENVLRFTRSAGVDRLFVSVLTIGELRKGAEMRRRASAEEAAQLHDWIDEVEESFGNRMLPVELPAATLWGRLATRPPRPTIDALLAATAIILNLTLVTRNIRDVADTGVAVLDPWQYIP
jgi:predicted nucleic acid-binding protein